MEIVLCTPAPGEQVNLIPQSQFAFLRGEKVNGRTADGKLISWDWKNPCLGTNDDSFPEKVIFSWKCAFSANFTLFLSEDSGLASPLIYPCGRQDACSIDNLKMGTRYFWAVAAAPERAAGCRSEISHFSTGDHPPRWIRVPGLSNVRDCGGWTSGFGGKVKQGMLFRGSEMDNHLNIKSSGMKIMLEDLKIKTELDIRSLEEIRKAGRESAFGPDKVNYIFYELKPYDMFFRKENNEINAECLSLFLNPEVYPVYCHCYGGADRTGTLVFLLLALLGVADLDLIKDYELTTFSAFGTRSCESDYFMSFRSCLNRYGFTTESFSVKAERYFRSIGIGTSEIKQFRTLLLLN